MIVTYDESAIIKYNSPINQLTQTSAFFEFSVLLMYFINFDLSVIILVGYDDINVECNFIIVSKLG